MCGIQTRWKQTFYDDVEPLLLRDPLAEFLGAVEEGEPLVFTYQMAVSLAGHSCPAVAGAYQMTRKALEHLYPGTRPVRGDISVRVLGRVDHGANGPIAQVIGLITGAAPETGFAGLGPKFGRKNKLTFDATHEEPNTFVFTRDDTRQAVKIAYHPEKIPHPEELSTLMTKCLVGTASAKQTETFKKMWQDKVRAVLLEEVKGLFVVRDLR